LDNTGVNWGCWVDDVRVYTWAPSDTASGRISGPVTNGSTGAALSGVTVQVYSNAGVFVSSTNTDSAGAYTLGALPTGSYFARTFNSQGFINQLYNSISCATSCTVTSGTPISVVAGSTTSNINFALVAGGRISGKVTNVAGGAALANIGRYIDGSTGGFVTSGVTDTSGGYTTNAGVPTGSYYAVTSNSQGYIELLYNNITCLSCSPSGGTPISVTAGSTTSGINFALTVGGRISGRVTNSAGGAALANIEVDIYNANNQWLTYGYADASGSYTTYAGLPTGAYYALTWNNVGYINQLFDNIVCLSC